VEHVDGYKRIRNPFLGEVEFKLKLKQQREANNTEDGAEKNIPCKENSRSGGSKTEKHFTDEEKTRTMST
jgi:hypothetical protein